MRVMRVMRVMYECCLILYIYKAPISHTVLTKVKQLSSAAVEQVRVTMVITNTN